MELFIRATVIYWFLWIVIRGTGKRSLAELTPLDLLLIVILGDFVQQGVTQEDMSMTGAMIAVSVFVLWTLAADYWGRRSRTANLVLASEPVIVLRSGEPIMSVLPRHAVSRAVAASPRPGQQRSETGRSPKVSLPSLAKRSLD